MATITLEKGGCFGAGRDKPVPYGRVLRESALTDKGATLPCFSAGLWSA